MCLKRLEELTNEIQQIDQFLSLFINNTPILSWIKDIDGKFLYVNLAFLNYFNIESELDLYSSDEKDQYLKNDKEVWTTGETRELIETLNKDGYVHHFYSIKFKIDGVGIGGMAIDLNGSVKKLLLQYNTI